jgi:hypothetical protein
MTDFSHPTRLGWLRNRHQGERCVLVANGPSLNQMNLDFLRRETVIGLNKITLGLQRFGFYPRYYVAVNPKVLQQAGPEIRALNCVKFLGEHAQSAGLVEDALTYVVRPAQRELGFSTDLAQGMLEGWTVTFAALQVAYHLGFDEVALIGLDHRYRFEGLPNETRVMHGPDPNHFSDQYFAAGQAWDNPDLARSEQSYRRALEAFERAGRRVLDATLGGACTVFPKVDYKTIFNC